MGPFEQQVTQLVLERQNDKGAAGYARQSYRLIADRFDRIAKFGRFNDHFVTIERAGGYGVNLKKFPEVRTFFPGYLFFYPRNATGTVQGGIGHTKDSRVPVIIIQHPRYDKKKFLDEFPQKFAEWWRHDRLYRTTWFHEVSHWVDSKRNPTLFNGGGSAAIRQDRGMQGYMNSPPELQAYFVEISSQFYELVDKLQRGKTNGEPLYKLIASAHLRFGSFRKFLEVWREWANPSWWENLTRENRRRVYKRAATVYAELVDRLDDILVPGWQDWTTEDIIAAAKAEGSSS